jgi:hypothetical protein
MQWLRFDVDQDSGLVNHVADDDGASFRFSDLSRLSVGRRIKGGIIGFCMYIHKHTHTVL